jgi:hypothetical protein
MGGSPVAALNSSNLTSLAHGWAPGPAPILTGYVLGVQPAGGSPRDRSRR